MQPAVFPLIGYAPIIIGFGLAENLIRFPRFDRDVGACDSIKQEMSDRNNSNRHNGPTHEFHKPLHFPRVTKVTESPL